jgi:hypothetical protein
VTFTLNVNTCDVAGFTTSYGPCGTFNVTWVEMPASVGGSTVSRGDFQQTTPGGGKVVINGNTETYSALMTGTALGFAVPASTIGALQKLTNDILFRDPGWPNPNMGRAFQFVDHRDGVILN